MISKSIKKFFLSCLVSSVIACCIVIAPVFFTNDDEEGEYVPPSIDYEKKVKAEVTKEMKYRMKDNIAVFSSNDCNKNTYYVNRNNVQLLSNIDKASAKIYILNKGDELVSTKEEKGYVYCETNYVDENGKLINGWVKKNIENLSGLIYLNYDNLFDVDITKQVINIYKNNVIINENPIKCSTGRKSSQRETPIGIFKVKKKELKFLNKREKENARYGICFFNNYFINSVSFNEIRKNDKIVDEENEREKNSLGKRDTNGGIRLSLKDAQYIYNIATDKSVIFVHY